MTTESMTDRAPPTASTSANPVLTRPGSMPRIGRGALAGARSGGRDGLDDLVGNVVVRVDRLDVVQLLQRLDQAQHLWRVLPLDANRRLWYERHLGLEHGDPRRFERRPHGVYFSRGGGDLESFFHATHVRGAGLQGARHEIVLADLAGVDQHDAFALEHPPDRPRRPHVAAVLLEGV